MLTSKPEDAKLDKLEKQRKLALQKKYVQRITIARQGRDAFLTKDYVTASKKYNEYLSILAESKDIEDIFKLTPSMFDNNTQVTELMLISHIYWELARIHLITPKLHNIFHKALAQFVKFTINQPYQVLNSEMLRKYIKKNKSSTPDVNSLNDALSQIHVQSKKCFIATECFGPDHFITNQLRNFKIDLLQWPYGHFAVASYYRFSSKLISDKQKHKLYAKLFITFSKQPLRLFAKLTETSIFKKCSCYLKSLPKNGLHR